MKRVVVKQFYRQKWLAYVGQVRNRVNQLQFLLKDRQEILGYEEDGQSLAVRRALHRCGIETGDRSLQGSAGLNDTFNLEAEVFVGCAVVPRWWCGGDYKLRDSAVRLFSTERRLLALNMPCLV